MIDLTKYDKADVLAALYNHAKAQGMGLLHYTPEDMTREQATIMLEHSSCFDYVHGRVMKVDLKGDTLDPRLYDRDNGEGAAERAIATI